VPDGLADARRLSRRKRLLGGSRGIGIDLADDFGEIQETVVQQLPVQPPQPGQSAVVSVLAPNFCAISTVESVLPLSTTMISSAKATLSRQAPILLPRSW
jgi:hypothetical protein